MNKLIKGSVAGAAGIALLLGGAGTLASWNDSAVVSGAGTITAGTLEIDSNPVSGTDGWQLNGTGTVEDDAADFTIVPGDVLTYTATFDVTATGDNLAATVALGSNSIAAASTDAEDVALASFLTDDATITVNGTETTTVNAAVGTQTVVVTVSIEFDNGAAGVENDAMLGEVSLSNFNVTLTQD